METILQLYDFLHHLPDYLNQIASYNLALFYLVIFLVVFAETGLVVTPFLPGDSLLFALGAIGRRGVGINLPVVTVLLMAAAVLGDAVNYWIGYRVGPKVFTKETSRLLNRKHLLRAHEFYEKYGGKTIILARFVPVVRTFAPFVAGVGRMNFFRFWLFNIVGGVAWVLICVSAGYFLGSIRWVKDHFEVVIVLIVFVSVLPMAFEFWQARRAARRGFAVAAPPKPATDSAEVR